MTDATSPPTTHAVSLDAGGEPITGTVTGPDGVSVPFRGWLELAEAIERCRRP